MHQIDFVNQSHSAGSAQERGHAIDTRLLDLLFSIRQAIDPSKPFHVISGYRSAENNAFLRAHTTGVAENSLHLVGKQSTLEPRADC